MNSEQRVEFTGKGKGTLICTPCLRKKEHWMRDS